MSKPAWGKIGAWAAEAEREEAEEREAALKAAAAQPPPPQPSFPSLKEGVTTATKQKKKTKMSLHEFTKQQLSNPDPTRGLTHEEMLRLPTGPKERAADEMQQGRLGGGFSSYGTRPGPGYNQDRRSYGGFQEEDDRRGGTRVSDFDQPSRADGVDNWGSMKKQTVPEYNSGLTRPVGKYSALGGGGGGGGGPAVGSRADEVDSWASAKKQPFSQPQQQTRSSSFGSGYSRPETDRWTRDSPKMEKSEVEVVKVNKANPFGAARPREEVLAEKGLDWKKLDSEIEVKKQQPTVSERGSRPTSSQSSRPGSAQSSRSEVAGVGEGAVKQKPKVNPFGDAKPREVLLEEKGLDWKKIDLNLEHRRVERPETEEEKKLKEEIEHLKNELLKKPAEDQTSSHDLILQKEQELEVLVRQLDDKVRYSQRNFERPGSGGGRGERPPSRSGPAAAYEEPRSAGYPERPHSRPGMYEDHRAAGSHDRPRSRQGATYEEPRGGDHNERLRSRGAGNSWARPGDDRRGIIQGGGGGRGFLGSRDVDRSGSRW